ncbi:MAG: hypothetical protein ACREJM_12725 [Candidatus Saccharimonadales bacterium]
MMRTRLAFCGGLVLLLAAPLAACGSGQAAAPSSSTPAASRVQVAGASASARTEGAGGEREGGGEGGEGGEGGAGGEGGQRLQRVAITVTDSGLQPTTLSARAGVIEFDVTNKGQQPHDVAVTGNGTNGDSGMVAPGSTGRFQGNLVAGSYQLKLDPTKQPAASPVPLTVH